MRRMIGIGIMVILGISLGTTIVCAESKREAKRKAEMEELQERFAWWPTDATPGPVQDTKRGGYWWMPRIPGEARPWGNQGYIYVYKIIYDYKAQDEDVAPVVEEPKTEAPKLKPSLLVKKIIKNVKIYFDYNKADLREDHVAILQKAVKTLQRNLEASILITGNCDARGSEEYNLKLGNKRGESVKQFMLNQGIAENRVLIISRGKLNAVAPVSDLVGMQKDRNAQFMIAEVEEVMIPKIEDSPYAQAQQDGEGKYLVETQENVETAVKVTTREYVVQKDDSLSKIAQKELGAAHRWKYLYELNKDRIKDPNKLKVGQKLVIPVE